jgi:WD40 repeat protein
MYSTVANASSINSGAIYVYSAQSYTSTPVLSHILELPPSRQWSPTANLPRSATYGKVKTISWTADGYALAAGYDGRGFAVWSVYGHLLCSSEAAEDITATAYKNSSQDM